MERYLLADSQVSRGYAKKKEKELVKFWAQNHEVPGLPRKYFLVHRSMKNFQQCLNKEYYHYAERKKIPY